MNAITFKGNNATINTIHGLLKFKISRVKGLLTYNVFKEDGSILKGGFLSIDDAKKWIKDYASFMNLK